jgi:AraC-like DNA-binding protein
MNEIKNQNKSGTDKMGPNKMAIKLLWYYLVILLVPTISITIIYFTAREALLDVQKEKSYRILTDAVSDFDREIEGIRNIATYLSEDTKILELSTKEDQKQSSYYDMYKIVDEFSIYALTNAMIEDIFIWFVNKDYIMSIPKVIPKTERGISTLPSFQGASCDELEKRFCEEYYYIQMECVEVKENNTDQAQYGIVQSLSSIDNGTYNGAAIITLNNRVINSVLKRIRGDNNSSVFLIDGDGKIIRSFLSNEYAMDNEEVSGMDYIQVSQNQKDVVTYRIESKYYSWSFVVATPKSDLTKKIGVVKYFMVFIYIMSILVGALICVYYWYNNKKMVDHYFCCSENLSVKKNVPGTSKTQNENLGFWKSLGTFLEQVENLQDTLDRQQEIVHKESIGKLLLGKYENIQEFEDEVGDEAERFLQFSGFYVVVVRVETSQISGDFLIPNQEIQAKVQSFFASELTIPHWIYPIEHYTYAMILADNQNRNIFSIKEELGRLNLCNQGVGGSFLGISQRVDNILKLSVAYEEALEICKSVSFFQIHVPLIREDAEEIRGEVMSLENEFQLEQILLNGSENDLEAILLQIRELNSDQVQHLYWLTHMINMLQCILVRCLKKENDDFSNQLIAKAQKAEWPDEIFALLRTAKRHQVKVAEEKRDKQREEIKLELEKIIQEQYPDVNFSLVMLAESMNISEQRLYKEFKLYFGVTFSDYLENLRIQKAGQLLIEGIAVKEVAVQVGYGSDYSFRRAFKRSTGMTPSTYIKIK